MKNEDQPIDQLKVHVVDHLLIKDVSDPQILVNVKGSINVNQTEEDDNA